MKFVDRTGEIHKDLQIIQDIGGDKVTCRCIKCGKVGEYPKAKVVKNIPICIDCGIPYRKELFTDRTGEIHKDLEILEELGKDAIKCRCIKCGHIDTYRKSNIVGARPSCKQCSKYGLKSKLGEIHKGLQIIQELGNKKVMCKCINCGNIDEYLKNSVTRDAVFCRKCGNIGQLKDKIGAVYRDLRIIEELGAGKVRCKCTKCEYTDIYDKGSLVRNRLLCKNCGNRKRIEGKSVNNVTVMKFGYIGRDNKEYYNCVCNKCGGELILTRAEIINYTCNKI